jgi:hypothetical protein
MFYSILQRGTPRNSPVYTGPVDENYVTDTTTEEILISILVLILLIAFYVD